MDLNGRCPTGVSGLDEVLYGGLVKQRAYLVRGGPGTGKTTLGLHFLRTGVERGQRALLITLESNEKQLREDAAAQGLSLEGVRVLDLSPVARVLRGEPSYDIFSPADVERDPTTQQIVRTIEELRPERVFVDAITTLRYLAPDAFQFRKQALSFLRYLVEHGATVLMSSEPTASVPDDDLRFMSDGIMELTSPPCTARSAGRSPSPSCAAPTSREDCTRCGSPPGGWSSIPRLIPASYERDFTAEHRVVRPSRSWTRCWAAASSGGRSRS